MSATPIQQSETELAQLKQRAEELQAANDQLDRDLATAVARARTARLSMQEIAGHIGIDRTTLYARLKRTQKT
jgi:DNA-directed RNA polymerase specialized sigma24 family protein